jgi:hypothetical protein
MITHNYLQDSFGTNSQEAGHFDEAINTYYCVMVVQRALKGERTVCEDDSRQHNASAAREVTLKASKN